jgi:hypothetical protein
VNKPLAIFCWLGGGIRDRIRGVPAHLRTGHVEIGLFPGHVITSALDKVFTMKSAKFREMLSSKEFWLYYVARLESGDTRLAEAVTD